EVLQPATLSILEEARSVLNRILDACDSIDDTFRVSDAVHSDVRASYLPFERAIDATVATKLGSRQAVEEIAFMAQLELSQRSERLARLKASQGVATLLSECDSSLRRIRKALSAVDVVISSVTSTAPNLDFTSELETSLALRRAYAKFKSRVIPEVEPSPTTLRGCFRAVGTQIA